MELAFVAIPLFMVVFAAVELGRAFMSVQALEEAARSGCRIAILKGRTSADAEAEIQRLTQSMGLHSVTTEILPASLETMPQWDPVTVRISADFDGISWLPMPEYVGGYRYTASCVFPREAEQEF
ncbi:TadE-like protein [Roseimaritima ulvae]|uniref:TadE-like protein n=1 Tax=Roseimaritima ulvae TaxID=980254 RepID=A0A5B9QYT6_9BACT|nr:TadE-like protein [Roseimaritima ulvae]